LELELENDKRPKLGRPQGVVQEHCDALLWKNYFVIANGIRHK